MRLLGCPVDTRQGSASFLVTQTAKFVPGSIWHAVGRISAAGRLDVPRRAAAAGMVLEAGASVFAALAIGVGLGASGRLSTAGHPVGPTVLSIAVAAAGVVALLTGWRLARRWWAGTPGTAALPTLAWWHLAVWAGYAVAAAAVGAAFGVNGALVAGAFTISWAAGFVVPGVPAGLGIREVVMTAALGTTVPVATALAVVVASRAVWTLVQVGLAGVAAGMGGRLGLVPERSRG